MESIFSESAIFNSTKEVFMEFLEQLISKATVNDYLYAAGRETFQKRCFNVKFYAVWTFLERHVWIVYLMLEAKR